jgi:hypothetical protein
MASTNIKKANVKPVPRYDELTGRKILFKEVSFVSDKVYTEGDTSREYAFMKGNVSNYSFKIEFGTGLISHTDVYDADLDGLEDAWHRTVYSGNFSYSRNGSLASAVIKGFETQSVNVSVVGGQLYDRATVWASDLKNGKGLKIKDPSSFIWPELLPYQDEGSELVQVVHYGYRDSGKVYYSGDAAKESALTGLPWANLFQDNWHLSPFSNLI